MSSQYQRTKQNSGVDQLRLNRSQVKTKANGAFKEYIQGTETEIKFCSKKFRSLMNSRHRCCHIVLLFI